MKRIIALAFFLVTALAYSAGSFSVKWFNPRTGGALVDGTVRSIEGGKPAALGNPPADASEDWLILVRR
jgi:hypothetical protein